MSQNSEFKLYEVHPDVAREMLSQFVSDARRRLSRGSPLKDLRGVNTQESILIGFCIVARMINPDFAAPPTPRNSSQSPRDAEVEGGSFECGDLIENTVADLAYLFGEAIVANAESARWDIGPDDSAEMNMPVVAGLRGDVVVPVFIVVNNLLGGMVSGMKSWDFLVRAVALNFELAS